MARHPFKTRAIQMNNSKTPKIVVGVGLVAAYAAGLTFLTLRDAPESAVAESQTSALSAQMTAAPALPPMGTPESASGDVLAPEASAAVEVPVPSAPVVANAAKAPEATRPAAVAPKPRVEEVPVASLPSPRPPVPSDAEELSRSNTGSNAVSELAASSDSVASETVTSAEDAPEQENESTDEVPAAAIGN